MRRLRGKGKREWYKVLGYVRTVPWEQFGPYGSPSLKVQTDEIIRIARERYKGCQVQIFIDTEEVLDVADSMMFMRLLKEAIGDRNTFIMIYDDRIAQSTFLIGSYPIVRAKKKGKQRSTMERLVDFRGVPLLPELTYQHPEKPQDSQPPCSPGELPEAKSQNPDD